MKTRNLKLTEDAWRKALLDANQKLEDPIPNGAFNIDDLMRILGFSTRETVYLRLKYIKHKKLVLKRLDPDGRLRRKYYYQLT